MNTGLQEAHNLACALADVLVARHARPRDSTGTRPSAGRSASILVDTTDRAFAAVTADGPIARFVRGRIVPIVGPIVVRAVPRIAGGGRVFGYLSQTRIHYRMSPRASSRRDRVVGRRLPWTGGNFDVLRSFTWQVHGYGAYEPEVRTIAESLGLEWHVFPPDPHRRLDPGARVPRAARRVRGGRGIRSRRAGRAARVPGAARGMTTRAPRIVER